MSSEQPIDGRAPLPPESVHLSDVKLETCRMTTWEGSNEGRSNRGDPNRYMTPPSLLFP